MKIELYIRNKLNDKVYDLSSICNNIQWKTDLSFTAGTLEIALFDDNAIFIREGDEISLKCNDIGIFYGWVFKYNRDEVGGLNITAYDQLRYFKNKTVMVRGNVTASQLFESLCKDYNLKYKIVTASTAKLNPHLHDNDSLYDIQYQAMKETTILEKKFYIIRDNFGVLEFLNPFSLKTNLFIGDKSLLSTYNFESTIDENTYNLVKVTYKDTDKNIRQVFNVYADDFTDTAPKWGILSEVYESNAALNEGLATELGRNYLAVRNVPEKTITMSCIGDLRVRAGVLVLVYIESLFNVEMLNTPKYYMIKNCTHSFKNNLHTMDIEIVIPKEGLVL